MSYVVGGVEILHDMNQTTTARQAANKDATVVVTDSTGLTRTERLVYSSLSPVQIKAMLDAERRKTQAAIDAAKADAAAAAAIAQAEYDAQRVALTTPNMQSWTEVSVAYNRLIEQMKLAFVMWGSGNWGADVNSQVIPGSGGADTVGGFTNGTLPTFIGGDFSQANRIIDRCRDLATNSRPTPDAMRTVAGNIEKATRDIVQAVFNGTLKVGQDPAPPVDYTGDGGGGGGGGGYEEEASSTPGWLMPVGLATAVYFLFLRKK